MAFKKSSYQIGEDTRINLVEPIRSKEDIKRIIDFFHKRNWNKYAVIFELGINSGLRISDILGLKVRDVRDKSKVRLREQKTGKVKFFQLKDQLRELLNDFCYGKDDDSWLFPGRQNKKLDRSQVYRRINEAIHFLKIDANVGTHTLRKTFGYHHYKQFHDIAVLQEIFNHTSPEVTKRYIGITQDEIDDTYLSLDLTNSEDSLLSLAKKGDSKSKVRAIGSFCKNYVKNTGGVGIHCPFAEIILEILNNPTFCKK